MSELSFGEVGEILHLLQEVECSEIDLEWGDLKIQVRKHGASTHPRVAQESPAKPTSMDGEAPQERPRKLTSADLAAPVEYAANQQSEVDETVPSDWVAIRAPMAGTFYRSPSPDKPPFAEVGVTVNAGDTVAVIEVMKLFTELKAEIAGKVARVDVPDGGLVEFGQSLVWIEPV